jgi:hypothetical protein
MTTAVPDPSDDFNLYLPDWATGTTTSWCVGAQLRTKDGRRLGNAVIASYRLGELSPWEVVTDAGTTLRLDEAELDELFWPPSWVMDVATSPGVRARTALAQPEPQGPTDEEFLAMRSWSSHGPTFDSDLVDFGRRCYMLAKQPASLPYKLPEPEEPTDENLRALWGLGWQSKDPEDGAVLFAKEVLARWSRPAIEPVPVSERFEFSVFDEEYEEQAGGPAPTYDEALSYGRHYLAQYQQDGPHSLEIRRVEVLPAALPVPGAEVHHG